MNITEFVKRTLDEVYDGIRQSKDFGGAENIDTLLEDFEFNLAVQTTRDAGGKLQVLDIASLGASSKTELFHRMKFKFVVPGSRADIARKRAENDLKADVEFDAEVHRKADQDEDSSP